jgi:hypothetical protein
MMARWLVDDLRHYGSSLAAFVIMPEHLHWVCTVPAWLVNRIKSNSGKALNNDLTPQERAALSQRAGLNGRSVCMPQPSQGLPCMPQPSQGLPCMPQPSQGLPCMPQPSQG